jgi:carbon monoxide dehydrogenase subunit G
MKLETDWKPVNAKPEAVFAFLSDMNNMQKLMPEQVINWTSDVESCQFMIKGMAELGMKITNKTASSSIMMSSHGKVPFPFTLEVQIQAAGENSESRIQFDGEVNAFLRMMVEKPLSNFFGMLLDGLRKQF